MERSYISVKLVDTYGHLPDNVFKFTNIKILYECNTFTITESYPSSLSMYSNKIYLGYTHALKSSYGGSFDRWYKHLKSKAEKRKLKIAENIEALIKEERELNEAYGI